MDKETVVCQSRWCYVDHFIPEDGKGITLAVELHNVSIKCYFTHTLFFAYIWLFFCFQVLEKYQSLESILSISCDGCTTNTGLSDGANRILEECLGFALQWLVCDLHCNENVFRHLFYAIGKLYNSQPYVSMTDVRSQ